METLEKTKLLFNFHFLKKFKLRVNLRFFFLKKKGYKGHFITFNVQQLSDGGILHQIESSRGEIENFLNLEGSSQNV
jgi:hypothetical protein